MVAVLERGLQNYARVMLAATGQDVAPMVGGGAAGGMGAAARVFLNATLKSGIDIVLEAVHLEEALRDADLVITGEGRMDSQTVGGKAPSAWRGSPKSTTSRLSVSRACWATALKRCISMVLMRYSVFYPGAGAAGRGAGSRRAESLCLRVILPAQ
jgi:hypothetical protein